MRIIAIVAFVVCMLAAAVAAAQVGPGNCSTTCNWVGQTKICTTRCSGPNGSTTCVETCNHLNGSSYCSTNCY